MNGKCCKSKQHPQNVKQQTASNSSSCGNGRLKTRYEKQYCEVKSFQYRIPAAETNIFGMGESEVRDADNGEVRVICDRLLEVRL